MFVFDGGGFNGEQIAQVFSLERRYAQPCSGYRRFAMELISVGNVLLNLERISALDIDQKDDGTVVLRVLTDSPTPSLA
ncbi:MAG: hypothetical protein DMG57_30170 [Acidobacteria bacterium]|nr:MAG: hypothetical protein DMG57_30170 [Acidobacteriota bacterium]